MLAYESHGAGRPLVFLHGMGSTRQRWSPIVEMLSGSFRCVTVDLPGHGESPAEGCDALAVAMATHELVEHLGLERPVLIGHSLGANVALLYGALFGPASVIAVDPAPLHLPTLSASLAPYVDRLRGADFARAFAEWERDFSLHDVPSPLRESLEESLAPAQEVVLSFWQRLLNPIAAAELQPQFESALTSITAPVLVCLAAEPSRHDAAILARMGSSTVEVFAGMSHYLHLVDPDRFAERVRKWCETLG